MKIELDSWAYKPERAHADDAGLDIKAPFGFAIAAHGDVTINTGVHVELPQGTAGMLVSKSGLNVRNGIISTGLVDCGYSGQITVKLYNLTDKPYMFEAGDKITQLVIIPILTPTIEYGAVEGGERGDSGFGSTGR